MKKYLSFLLALAITLSAALMPGTVMAESEKKQGKSLSLARCESIGEGWRNVADLESTVSVDTENKAEGDASIKLVSSKDQADENGVRGKFYLRTGNIIDLTNYSELTFKFYVDRVIMNDNKLKIDLSSADEGNDGYSYEVNMKLWRKGWHDVTLDLTNLPEPSVATDKTSIKRICFTWLNVKKSDNLVFNVDDIRLTLNPDIPLPSLDSFEQSEKLAFGDVNSSGTVTAADALLALQASVGKTSLDTFGSLMADADGDSSVTVTDALLILMRSVKKNVNLDGEVMLYSYLDKSLATKHKLTFASDGKFKILEISDIHNNRNDGKIHAETASAVAQMLDETKPDLLVLNGDTIMHNFTGSYEQRVKDVTGILTDFNAILAERNVYWLATFGNHDYQCGVSKDDQMKIYESLSHCLAIAGEVTADQNWPANRVGNYVSQVYDSTGKEVKLNLWCLDSGIGVVVDDTNNIPGDNNAYIMPAQLEWYQKTSAGLEAMAGTKVPGIMFAHIPIPEFKEILLDKEGTHMTGHNGEAVCSSGTNSGMFDALLARGDVLSFNAAHDHTNTFAGIYKGIELSYDGSLAYDSYGGYYGEAPNKSTAGGRLITVDQSDVAAYTAEFVQYVPKA